MSGALEIIGGLSSLITIVETTQKLYDQLKQDVNLPTTYQQVSPKLALWSSALEQCQQDARLATLSDEDKVNCKSLVQDCEDEIESLKVIFESVLAQPGDRRRTQFVRKWQRINKGKKVNQVLLDINDHVTALVNYRVLTDVRPSTTLDMMQELKSLAEQLASLQDYLPEENERVPTVSNRAETQQGFFGTNTGGSTAFGYVANLNHYSAPRPPPPPTMVECPERNPTFVDRDALDSLLTAWTNAPRMAIVGLGGSGKSALALEFAYRIHTKLPSRWIFWVKASSLQRFEDSYRAIALALQIPNYDRTQFNLLLVKTWLSNKVNGEWLMVVDNADDREVFLAQHQATSLGTVIRPISEWLPTGSHGFIVITSRDKSIARSLVSSVNIVEIGVMTPSEAVEMMKRRISTIADGQAEAVARLAEELDFIPLAISQALAYMQNRKPYITASQYLEILGESDEQRTKLLQTAVADPLRESSASNAPLLTWQISFETILRNNPSAASLISLMSMFDRHSIPAVQRQMYDPTTIEKVGTSSHDLDFASDVTVLQDFDLIDVATSSDQYKMHALVQLATRYWLESHGELERWQGIYITTLYTLVPESVGKDFGKWRSLIPHVLRTTSLNPREENTRRQLGQLLDYVSEFCRQQHFMLPLETLTKKLAELVPQDDEAFDSDIMARLAVRRWFTMTATLKPDSIVKTTKKLAEDEEQRYGPTDSRSILFKALYGLFLCWYGQDNLGAEEVVTKTLEQARSLVPRQEGCIIYCMICAFTVHFSAGRYAEAELLAKELQILTHNEDTMAFDDMQIMFRTVYASFLCHQDKIDEGIECIDRLLTACFIKYDPASMTMLRVCCTGGFIHAQKGNSLLKFDGMSDEDIALSVIDGRTANASIVRATQLYQKAIQASELRGYGMDGHTALAMEGLAMCYLWQNQIPLALQLVTKAVEWFKKHYGKKHPCYKTASGCKDLILEFAEGMKPFTASVATSSSTKIPATECSPPTPALIRSRTKEKEHGFNVLLDTVHSFFHRTQHRHSFSEKMSHIRHRFSQTD